MRLANLAIVSSLLAAGCASMPEVDLPDGTYRAEGAPGDALIVEGNQLQSYLPTLQKEWKFGPSGRHNTFRLEDDGRLRLWGSSNDGYFLRQDCDWRWTGSAIECRRKDGTPWRFVRNASGAPLPPVTPEQKIWLAVAQRVRENDKSSARRAGPLPIYSRTSFPSLRASVTQMEKQARAGFCGLPQAEAGGVVRSLRWINRDPRSIGDVFDHRPEFVVPQPGRRKRHEVGLSAVVFNGERDTAYVNADIGGRSGSIVQVKLANGEWIWAGECATWVSWR